MRRPNHCIGGEIRATYRIPIALDYAAAGTCLQVPQMAQEMVGKRLTLMCVEVSGELREPNPQKGIVSSKTGFFGEGCR